MEIEQLDGLLTTLRERGFTVVGPRVLDSAIIYDEITSTRDLPVGWTDEQRPAFYRLKQRADKAFFGFSVGPQSWKKFLFPPLMKIFGAEKNGESIEVKHEETKEPKYAFFGVRPCELEAILIQDKVFLGYPYLDQTYKKLRENLLLVAVNCTSPGANCFCTSMKTGPKATRGFDLALTEVVGDGGHYFVADVGSEKGIELLNTASCQPIKENEIKEVESLTAATVKSVTKHIDMNHLKEILGDNHDNAQWDALGRRCLTCANCTMVCPTCFCFAVEDVSDLTGKSAERWRTWDSCFSVEFSYIHGGSIRSSPKSRFRQWMTHKLASWVGQFESYGCVGCGRCITWCPVGIDITEEARALRKGEKTQTIS